MKQVIVAVHPSIDIKEFVEKNPHLCEYVKEYKECSDKRLPIVNLTWDMAVFLEGNGYNFVVVMPSPFENENSGELYQEYLKYAALREKEMCTLVLLKDNEDMYWAIDQWEEIFFPIESPQSLVTPAERSKMAWEALKTFPLTVKESMDIKSVAEYAVELADQMILELNRPKIQY